MQEDFEPENNDNELLDIENYSLPEKKEVVLDLKNNKIEEFKKLSPLQMIVHTAKENKIELKDFDYSKNYIDTGCRKKGCWGRGYTAWDDNIPIPCVCLFKDKDTGMKISNNRTNVRRYVKQIEKETFEFKMKQAKCMNLKNVGNGFWKSKTGIDFVWAKKNDKWGFQKYSKAEKDLVE